MVCKLCFPREVVENRLFITCLTIHRDSAVLVTEGEALSTIEESTSDIEYVY